MSNHFRYAMLTSDSCELFSSSRSALHAKHALLEDLPLGWEGEIPTSPSHPKNQTFEVQVWRITPANAHHEMIKKYEVH